MNSITHFSKHARHRERKKRKKENIKIEKLERDRKTRELRPRKVHERLAAKICASFGSSKMSFWLLGPEVGPSSLLYLPLIIFVIFSSITVLKHFSYRTT